MTLGEILKWFSATHQRDLDKSRKFSAAAKHRAAQLFLYDRLSAGESLEMIEFVWGFNWPELKSVIETHTMTTEAHAAVDAHLRMKDKKA